MFKGKNIDTGIGPNYHRAVELLAAKGYKLVGAVQSWPGLYTNVGSRLVQEPATHEGQQPPSGTKWGWYDEYGIAFSDDEEWATTVLNRYSGTEYPVNGYFTRK